MAALHKIENLNSTNYETWKVQVRALLTRNQVWKYVNGSLAKPDSPEEASAWSDKDEMAKADLIMAMCPSELKHIRGCETSHDIWRKLEKTYASKGPVRKASLLKKLTLNRMKEGDDVQSHLNNFFEAANMLSDMGVEIHDDMLSILLLYSLPESYENFRCAMESRDELPNIEVLKIKILEKASSSSSTGTGIIEGAMYAKRKGFKKNSNSKEQNTKTSKFMYKCFKCHEVGHKASECKMKRNQDDVRCATESGKEDSTFDILFNCTNFSNSLQIEKNDWILDSGCTSHLCNDFDKFTNNFCILQDKLNLVSNLSTDVKGKGDVRLSASGRRLILKNTLYVPDLRSNLLSVARIADNGYVIQFTKDRACINESSGKTVMTAERIGNLYVFKRLNEQAYSIVDSIDIVEWHNRVGHLNGKDLLKL